MSLANITSVPYANITQVTVTAAQPNGTTVLLYANNVLQGTGVLNGSTATITVPPLVEGDALQAYVTTKGNLGGDILFVLPPQAQYSGWQVPSSVDGETYATYLANGGTPIAEYYDPSILGNIARQSDYENLSELYNVTYQLIISYQSGQGVVTVVNPEYVGDVALVQFDSDEISTGLSKSYTANGTYSVTVFNDTLTRSRQVTFDLNIPASAVSSNSWGYLYNFQTVSFSQVQCYALPTTIMGFQIEGFHATVQALPVKGTSNPLYHSYEFGQSGLPSGVYTIRFFEFVSGAWVQVNSQPLINQPT